VDVGLSVSGKAVNIMNSFQTIGHGFEGARGLVDAPSHLIHFNGVRFLGPHEAN
jgi:hypothetical protein